MSLAWLPGEPILDDDYHRHRRPVTLAPKRKKRRKSRNQCGSKTRRRIKRMLLVQDPHCKYCGCVLTLDTATIDHVLARSKGGGNNVENLVLACGPCNNRKGNS